MTHTTHKGTPESMREHLEELLPLQKKMRAELGELLNRAAERDLMYDKAFRGEGSFPDDEEDTAYLFDVMRRLSALNKEIISLMDQLPEYDDSYEDPI